MNSEDVEDREGELRFSNYEILLKPGKPPSVSSAGRFSHTCLDVENHRSVEIWKNNL